MADPIRPRPEQKRHMTVRLSKGTSEKYTQAADPAKLGSDLQSHIGRQLRSLYDEVLKEPVPDRLRDLLQKLEQKPPGQS